MRELHRTVPASATQMTTVVEAAHSSDPKPRRTNSLAFASTDCHKCATNGIVCDRSRPCCSTCIAKGLKCPGFVTPLSWDHRRMFVPRPVSGSGASSIVDQDAAAGVSQPPRSQFNTDSNNVQKKFRFVNRPATKRRKVTSQPPAQAARTQKVATDIPATEPSVAPSTVVELPELSGEQQTYEEEAVTSAPNEALFHVDGVDVLPSPATAIGANLASQFEPNFVPDATSTEFDTNFSWDELVEGACSLDASDSSACDTGVGDYFNLPQNGEVDTVSTAAPAEGALSTFVYDSMAELDNSIGVTTFQGLQDLVQEQHHGPRISQIPAGSQIFPLCIPPLMEPFYDTLLNMYESEFCILPVTHDMKLNPFRCQRDTPRSSRLLYHSIMALSYQHLNYTASSWPKEASEHRSRAREELSLALANTHPGGLPLHLLDSILINFVLECTLSASGPWTYYLMQAVTVLEAAGGVAALQKPRVRSQVAMLLWWDATLALVSRQGLVIDISYYEYLIQHEHQDEWSFYDLSGCPTVLFKLLVDLAQLAVQQEIAHNMKWLEFDPSPVYAIEKQLREVILDDGTYNGGHGRQSATQRNHGFCVDIDDEANFDHCAEEEEVNRQSDTNHCLEAWRHGLLTYIYRVFIVDRSKQSPKPSKTLKAPSRLWTATGRQSNSGATSNSSIPHHKIGGKSGVRRMLLYSARETMSHIRAVRRSSQTQKQLLLPIFWASSELSAPELREFARTYCMWWADKSRYQMFSSAADVLGEIWAQVDKSAGLPDGSKTPWWGTVIDQKTEGGPGIQKTDIHFLFG